MLNKILNNRIFFLLTIRSIFRHLFSFLQLLQKSADPEGFSHSIYNYKLMPDFLINFLAIVFPWIELVAGILLIFGISVKENSAILSGLLVIFIVAIAISLARGLNIDCGCFGTVEGRKLGIQENIRKCWVALARTNINKV